MIDAKYQQCLDAIRDLGKVAVACSGGVDSSLLVALAAEAVGASNVLAVTVASVLQPADEPDSARRTADLLGVELIELRPDVLAIDEVASNPADRCYHCKTAIFTLISDAAGERGITHVLSGDNADDPDDYRPGLRAIAELGICTPLKDAGLTKAEIRELSARLDLPTATKPSSACLASRVPYGLPLTEAKLKRIDAAETYLHDQGFPICRVRDHDPVARIELPVDRLPDALARREELLAALQALGWGYVTLDLRGYRTGALNEMLGQ
jgi:uncharacterized protein